jgi:hypothetical protein
MIKDFFQKMCCAVSGNREETMERVSLIFLVAAAFMVSVVLCYSATVRAQGPQQTQGTPVAQSSTLEERYTACINAGLCPLQTRLLIAQEENNEMNIRFQKFYETCATDNFQQGCVDNQQGELDMWHSAEYRTEQMMLSVEAQSLALKQAAAGASDKPVKKSLWDRMWGK